MIGLITNSSAGGFIRRIGVSTNSVNLHDLFGNPTVPVSYTLVIPAGVTVGGGASSSSLDATGLDSSSVGLWVVDGDILGKGGDGGDGGSDLTPGFQFKGGGGGGGAGVPVGAGGIGYDTATDGTDGSRLTGGAGGASNLETPAETTDAVDQTLGWDAVHINHPITIQLSGLIACGGVGGFPGTRTVAPDPGGDIGVSPSDLVFGFAIRYSESGDATVTGVGTVLGTVG